VGRKPKRNIEDTSDTLNQIQLLMKRCRSVGLRECREHLRPPAEAGKWEVASLPCTGRGSVSTSKGAARGAQGLEEQTDWIFSKILKVQERKSPTVPKGEAVRVCT